MIALGCEIEGTVENSILGSNVVVEKGAVVKDAVVLANSVIKAGPAFPIPLSTKT